MTAQGNYRTLSIVLMFTAGAASVGGCDSTVDISPMQDVVADVEQGKLKPDEHGIVALPADAVKGLAGPQAYVTGKAAAPDFVLFPVWRGKGANLRGYLYSPKAALKAGQDVIVVTPIPLVASPTAENEVHVDTVIGPKWYLVSRSLD